MIFSPGYKIGAYTVVRLLGQGGMGDVYEVVHEQLGTHYALKAFACDYEEAEVLQKKFLEEGRLLSKLTHPRIVRVFRFCGDRPLAQGEFSWAKLRFFARFCRLQIF